MRVGAQLLILRPQAVTRSQLAKANQINDIERAIRKKLDQRDTINHLAAVYLM